MEEPKKTPNESLTNKQGKDTDLEKIKTIY